jgi:uncharacterized Zn finger protein (UPF0148 family)
MKVRGQRECRSCGCRWSYYDTGSVACPACGSAESVGVDDRHLHTDAPAALDLSRYRDAAAEGSIADVLEDCKTDLRAYLRRRGFVHGGDLQALDDTVLAGRELRQALDLFDRLRDPRDAEREYLFALIGGTDAGERPPPERVPERLVPARGLGCANAVSDYRRDLGEWLDEHPDPEVRRTLGRVGEWVKRVRALQGDVDPATVESLVRAVREIGAYLRADDEGDLAGARDRLDRLDRLD